MKDKNIIKGDEEDAIASGRLADIIKESMTVFWEFVRADKDYGNVILKVSQQIGTDFKDPVISALLVDIRTQLQKVCFLLVIIKMLPFFFFLLFSIF